MKRAVFNTFNRVFHSFAPFSTDHGEKGGRMTGALFLKIFQKI